MHIVLFLFYGLVLGWLVTRMRFFRDSGLRPAVLEILFGLHVLAGCFQTWVAWRFFPSQGDVWVLFRLSFITRHELLTDFKLFVAHNSSWADLPHNVRESFLLLLNWLSFDNLYIDTLLFSFPVFMGSFALFRSFRSLFPGDSLTALSTLLFPSTLFWTSCIYTEGILYALTGWLLYCRYKEIPPAVAGIRKGWDTRQIILCLFIFLLAAFFRSYAFITLLPAQAAMEISSRKIPRRKLLFYIGSLVLLIVLLASLFPVWSMKWPEELVRKQKEFQALEGGSRLYLPVLDASWPGFFHTLPWALRNGLFEPLPGSGGKPMYLPFAFELLFVWAVVVITIVKKAAGRLIPGCFGSFTLYCLFYALTGMLLIGLIVPFAGAIVRYRSIYMPFLLAPFLHALSFSGPIKKINIKLDKYIYSSGL